MSQCPFSDCVHCIKSVRIRSFSGPYFSAFGLNTDQILFTQWYGSKISHPEWVNGGASIRLTLGKSAILSTSNYLCNLRWLVHLYIISLTTMFTISIQNPLWFKLFKVIPLPPWESSSWHHGMIASDMLLCFGRTTGWASLRESLDFLSLPLIRNKPLLSKKGSRFIHAQFIGFNFAVWVCTGSPYFFPKLLKLDHIN